MEGALDRRRERRRKCAPSIRIRAAELAQDLTLAGDRRVEARGNPKEVRDCRGVGAQLQRLESIRLASGLREPGARRLNTLRKGREYLNPMARDER